MQHCGAQLWSASLRAAQRPYSELPSGGYITVVGAIIVYTSTVLLTSALVYQVTVVCQQLTS